MNTDDTSTIIELLSDMRDALMALERAVEEIKDELLEGED